MLLSLLGGSPVLIGQLRLLSSHRCFMLFHTLSYLSRPLTHYFICVYCRSRVNLYICQSTYFRGSPVLIGQLGPLSLSLYIYIEREREGNITLHRHQWGGLACPHRAAWAYYSLMLLHILCCLLLCVIIANHININIITIVDNIYIYIYISTTSCVYIYIYMYIHTYTCIYIYIQCNACIYNWGARLSSSGSLGFSFLAAFTLAASSFLVS